MIKLFAVGFPRDMGEIELLETFTIYGVVKSVKIITEQETGVSLGYGFISMEDETGAKRAITALNGATLDERVLSVRIADDKRGDAEKSKPDIHEKNHVRPKRPRRK